MTRFLLAAALLVTFPAAAANLTYLQPAQVDLLRLLPPPPTAPDAVAAELAEVEAAQERRTPERTAQAVADANESVFDMFAPVLGARFTPAALPLATRLFQRLGETEDVVVRPAKDGFNRPRPYVSDLAIHPALPPSRGGSYPSGHATRSTIEGIVLSAMLPEQRTAIFARMQDYAESRLIAGMHHRSDLAAGTRAGTAITAVLFNDPGFRAEFGPARREVRAAFGLPDLH